MFAHKRQQRFAGWRFMRFGIGALALAGALLLWNIDPMATIAAETAPSAPFGDPAAPASFANVIEVVEPAVVNVSVRGVRQTVAGFEMSPGFPSGPAQIPGAPYDELLRRFFGEQPDRSPEAQSQPFESMGTGFLIDPTGLVVTNYHVVEAGKEVVVTLNDGTRYDAVLHGYDAKTDLALLDIDGDGLPYVEFGESDAVRAGDWVIAIGNPFGLGGSATAGIVSARGRDIHSGPYDDFLQIDAPINRGNSGGPLFALDGKVVGINTAIYSPHGGNVGIGFAIPAALARPVIEELRDSGFVERGWLGVQLQPVDRDIAAGLGMAEARGALVASVALDSPAAQAGLEAGDVIVGFEGARVDDPRDLARLVAAVNPADRVDLEVWRNGETLSYRAMLGKNPEDTGSPPALAPSTSSVEHVMGLSLSDISEAARARFGLAADVRGALVVSVERGGAADRKGLRPGDVLVRAGSRSVNNLADVGAAVDRARDAGQEMITLQVVRGDAVWFVALRIDADR